MNNNENIKQRSQHSDAPRRKPNDKDPAERFLSSLPFIVALPIALIYLELISHFAIFGELDSRTFVYMTFFSVSGGLVMALLCTLFNKKINYIITLVFLGIATLLCCVQVVYSAFFGDFFRLTTLGMAGNIADYMDNTFKTIFANLHWIILIFLPFILFAVFGRKSVTAEKADVMLRAVCAVLAVCFFGLGTLYVNSHDELDGDKYIYKEGFLVKDAINRFGIFTTARLELQYMIFGMPEGPVDTLVIVDTTAPNWNDSGFFRPTTTPSQTDSPSETGGDTTADASGTTSSGSSQDETTAPPPPPIDRSPQRLEIDFEKLKSEALAKGNKKLYNTHVFLESRAGTNKNEFTGLFEGKNLIYITVEGWAPAAINEKLTPTLYMMQNEGFVFENYYNSLWGGSTATGEYANMTGNFYYDAKCLSISSGTYQKYSLGNSLGALGYDTQAFHNHTYTYYSRDKSHPNFGYTWHGVGNWDVQFTSAWPKSDRELALNALSFMTADKPFHHYYMTVSGHAYQTFGGNRQAAKHRALVTEVLGNDYKNELSLSFIACQYEVELMVKELYDECERLGILEDTVFVLATDHFPYGLSENDANNQAALAELYGLPNNNIYANFDLYRSPLIIWSGSMEESVQVNKVCSATDILPTLLNLFGVEYDSRIIIGQDILDSSSEGFVILNKHLTGSHNFITDYGIFDFKTKKFTVNEGYEISDAALAQYVDYMRDYALKIRTYSPYILDYDYYKVVFPNG